MVSGNIMKISLPVEDPINISEEVKRCGVWKTVNSSNELAEKGHSHSHKRGNKKSKRSSSHKKSRKRERLSEIEEESFLRASIDKEENDDDDDASHEFITIKIDKADSVNGLKRESEITDDETQDTTADNELSSEVKL